MTFQFISDFSLAAILLAAMVIDYRFMIIPDKLNVTGAAIALIVSLSHGIFGFLWSIAGGLTGAALMAGLFWFGILLFRRHGLGLGDVKLAAVIGLFVGPLMCFTASVIAVFLGGLWGI
ncbi:prepilin peptidase [Candidatus Latescibacterota bacterium]